MGTLDVLSIVKINYPVKQTYVKCTELTSLVKIDKNLPKKIN